MMLRLRAWASRLKQYLKAPQSRRAVRQQRGRSGERLACAYLVRHGYEIEATNARFPVGELDIVAREGKTLCFVEVRTASSERFGSALDSITDRKRQHLVRAAQWYLLRRRVRWTGELRFDVIAIDARSGKSAVELIRGAFDAE